MTLYSTTAVPSYNLFGGVDALQRILKPHTEIARVAWDEKNHLTVAVLETHGTHNCLDAVARSLKQFEVMLFECDDLVQAIKKAKELAHTEEIFELIEQRVDNSSNDLDFC